MQTTAHAIQRRGRARWLFLAILLQVVFIFVLVKGLDVKVWPRPLPPPFKTDIIRTDHPRLPPPPVRPIEPQRVTPLQPPPIQFDTGEKDTNAITPPTRDRAVAGPNDHGPITIAATHTTPPYPPMEERLGHEGTVVLRLTIAADGRVADAMVVRSSGYERLDMAARDWVMGHWRYQPAVRGGAAAPAVTTVGVEFKIRGAG